jgi:YidC/Oxa1 family membrane protein insertase
VENRRFILFVIGSIFIVVASSWLRMKFFPPPPPPPEQKQPLANNNAEQNNAEKPADQNAQAEKPAEQNAQVEAPAAAAPEVPQLPTQWFTLGSADPHEDKNPYHLLVTLNNHGAAVERIELASEKYRDLENESGYLGHLAVENSPDGVMVNIVPPGTPAAAAGLKAGDIITAIDGKPIANTDALDKAIKATKPDQNLELAVSRGGQPQTLTATLTRRPLEVVRPELFTKEMQIPEALDIVAGSKHDPFSFLFTLQQIDKKTLPADASLDAELQGVKLRTANWEGKQVDADTVEFTRTLPDLQLEIVKRFKIAKLDKANPNKPYYHLTLEVELHNTGDATRTVAYQLDGPTGLPTEGWWYTSRPGRSWGGVGVRDTAEMLQGRDPALISPMQTAAGKLDPPYRSEDADALLVYSGVDAQYFACALLPTPYKDREPWLAQIKPIVVGRFTPDVHYQTLTDVSCRLVSVPETLKPGATLTHAYTVFAGPKQPNLLAAYPLEGDPNNNLGELVYYGWPVWAIFARLLTAVLHVLYSIVGNYGLAIILLTVVVRGCMYPISRKQAVNAQKMQELKPEMDRINEKYKGKAEEKTKAMQELWKKHNHNPMSGCLPALIQMPVFFGLYRALWVDVELRQAPLFGSAIHWCSNLAAPDMLWYWKDAPFIPQFLSGYRGMGSLGPYFNLLPIFTVVLFILQQQMFMPPATDDSSKTQQKFMKYMVILIGYMYYNVTSGLLLYIIVSSAWGIAERKLLPSSKAKPATAAATPAVRAKPSADTGNGAARRQRKKQRGGR